MNPNAATHWRPLLMTVGKPILLKTPRGNLNRKSGCAFQNETALSDRNGCANQRPSRCSGGTRQLVSLPRIAKITVAVTWLLAVQSRLFVRITFCRSLRGIVSPCRWREFVEPATAKNPVEAMQIHIECAFRGCPLRLQDASVKHFLRHFYWVAMIEVHAVVLIVAPEIEDHRVAQSSVDFISERY
jgi:hypothetical protein